MPRLASIELLASHNHISFINHLQDRGDKMKHDRDNSAYWKRRWNELEILRQLCRYRVNPYMERSEQKEFADYVMERQHVFDDYIQQAWRDLYENFRQDAGYE
jgi:hypothetical protein